MPTSGWSCAVSGAWVRSCAPSLRAAMRWSGSTVSALPAQPTSCASRWPSVTTEAGGSSGRRRASASPPVDAICTLEVVTGVIVELDQRGWAHVATALRAHVAWCGHEGIAVPDDVAALLTYARRSDTDRLGATDVRSDDALAHAVAMNQALAVSYAAAASRIGVSKRTIERLVAAGDLPTIDVGGAQRIRTADLAAYVDALPARRSFRDDVTAKAAS